MLAITLGIVLQDKPYAHGRCTIPDLRGADHSRHRLELLCDGCGFAAIKTYSIAERIAVCARRRLRCACPHRTDVVIERGSPCWIRNAGACRRFHPVRERMA